MAVVQGDPSAPGVIFTVRLRLPNGYVLPPHFHPIDEHATVISGTFLVGLGDVFSEQALAAAAQAGRLHHGARQRAPLRHGAGGDGGAGACDRAVSADVRQSGGRPDTVALV
jgi:hypothetical protein